MAYHHTATGSIDLIESWTAGQQPSHDWSRVPAVLIGDDNDGHYDAWRVTGSMRDAAEVIGRLLLRDDGRYVAIRFGNRVTAEHTPDDFWLDRETGGSVTDETVESAPNLTAYPDAVAW